MTSLKTSRVNNYLQFLPEGTSAVEQRSLAAQQLRIRVQQKERELALTSYIVDNCLHLVWLHLDFYLQSGLPLNRSCVGPESTLMPGKLSIFHSISCHLP